MEEVGGVTIQQIRNNHLSRPWTKPKVARLCRTFFDAPSPRCMAWSDDSLLAFASTEGLINEGSASLTPSGALAQPIFILHADSPEEYVSLRTLHKSAIRFLEWAPSSCGPLLLSADTNDHVEIWERKEYINNWTRVKSVDFENVVVIKWLSSMRREFQLPTTKASDDKHSSIYSKFLVPPTTNTNSNLGTAYVELGMPCFLCVSTNGLILVFFKRMFEERWSSIATKLSHVPAVPQGSLCIAHADVTQTPDGDIMLVTMDPFTTAGKLASVYKITLNLAQFTLTSQLIASFSLPDASPTLSPMPFPDSTIISSPIHIRFDPSSHGQALFTVTSALGNGASKVTSILSRWEFREREPQNVNDVIKTEAADEPKITEESAPTISFESGQRQCPPFLSDIWTKVPGAKLPPTPSLSSSSSSPVPSSSPSSSSSPASSSQSKAGRWEAVREVFLEAPLLPPSLSSSLPATVPPSFVTNFYCEGEFLFLTYVTGVFEVRQSKTLALVTATTPLKWKQHNNTKPLSSSSSSLPTSPSKQKTTSKAKSHTVSTAMDIPIALALSPNATSVATLTCSGQLCFYHLSFVPFLYSSIHSSSYISSFGSIWDAQSGAVNFNSEAFASPPAILDALAQQAADMLQLSLVKSSDWWDLALWLSLLMHTQPEPYRAIVRASLGIIVAEMRSVDSQQRSYMQQVFSLKGFIQRCIGDEAGFINTSARLYLLFIFDVLRSSLESAAKKSIRTDFIPPNSLVSQLQFYPKIDDGLLHLKPLSLWAMDFTVLLLKVVQHFVNWGDPSSWLSLDHSSNEEASDSTAVYKWQLECLQQSSNAEEFFMRAPPSIFGPAGPLPMLELILDENFLAQLRQVLVYSGIVIAQASGGSGPVPPSVAFSSYTMSQVEVLYAFVCGLSSFVFSIASPQQPQGAAPTQTSGKSVLQSLKAIHTSLRQSFSSSSPPPDGLAVLRDTSAFVQPVHDMKALLLRLNLLPERIGLLHRTLLKTEYTEENKVRRKRARQKASWKEPKAQQQQQQDTVALLRRPDVVTCQPQISSVLESQNKRLRQCIRCGRVSVPPLSSASSGADEAAAPTTPEVAFVANWNNCCPVCCGKWRLLDLSSPSSSASPS
ncbi:hypothetical protein QOT17_025187 [Balamuthia mandrillaris]